MLFLGVFCVKMVAIREIKKNPAVLYSDEEYRVLTSNNRPRALCFPLEDFEDIEDIVASFRQAQAMRAVEKIRKSSLERGLQNLSMEEIDAEIQATRKEKEREE